MAPELRGYEHDDAFDSGFLSVGTLHKLYYEQYGKKDGKPVVFLHGGPGGGTNKSNSLFFNPAIYRVIIFDQRGAGKSQPSAEIRENTSQDLVADIETLRKHLGIAKWHVFGGSWGSTLSLLYAQAHPEAVVSLNLRGVFMESKEELEFNVSPHGQWRMLPELYDEFIGHLDEAERGDVFLGYHKLLNCGDREVESKAARIFNKWSCTSAFLVPPPEELENIQHQEPETAIKHARIECHYHHQNAMIEDGQILKPENIQKIKHIPTGIVNGRYDLLCPPIMAWRLHKALPGSKLYIIPNAGHASLEPGIRNKLVDIADEFGQIEF